MANRGVARQLTVGNDRHVTDVGRVVHETTDLRWMSVMLMGGSCCAFALRALMVFGGLCVPPRR